MYLMLQQNKPEDYVVATGKTTEVREFVRLAFAELGIILEFKGEGINEKAFIKKCNNPKYQLEIGKEILAVDKNYFRPTEVEILLGNPEKANKKLNWKPKYDLAALVKDMMESDLKLMQKERYLKDGGYKVKNYYE